MNIIQAKAYVGNATYAKDLEVLERIYANSGDCLKNGYLGSSLKSISFDDYDNLMFDSFNDDTKTDSIGTVIGSNVIIKQSRTVDNETYCMIYSWDKKGKEFVYLEFNNVDDMNDAYSSIISNRIDINEGDLSNNLDILNINTDTLINSKIKQSPYVEKEEISFDSSDIAIA